jgi:NAD(P)-dependent dehydrogenase (short-subunit alcohol dehydrogenase family)
LGVDSIGIAIDVSCTGEIYKAVKEIEEKFVKIDVLANCVGISTSRLMLDVSESEWEKVMNVNLKSAFVFSKLIAQNMITNKVKHGKIVSISSQASKIGEYGNGVYCISKAALNMMTQVLGLELAQHGISVTAVCPGYVNTQMMQEVFQKRGPIEGMTPEEYEKSLTDLVPIKRLAEPSEIADFILFLSSERADYITGVSLTIAGGKTLI